MVKLLRSQYGEILPPGCPNLNYEVSMKINRYLFAAPFVTQKSVLDIGCATGYGSALLKAKGAKEITAIDTSIKALEIARRVFVNDGIHFLHRDAQKPGFGEDSFEAIIAFEVIEHLPNYRNFVTECSRMVSKEGILICSTPNKNAVSPGDDGTYRTHHFHEFFPDELVKLLSQSFAKVELYGCVRFAKKEKVRDDLLYKLALHVAPHLPLPYLFGISALANSVTWIPPLRQYRLIRVEKIRDWDSYRNPKFQPYLLNKESPVPLGLIAIASNPHRTL